MKKKLIILSTVLIWISTVSLSAVRTDCNVHSDKLGENNAHKHIDRRVHKRANKRTSQLRQYEGSNQPDSIQAAVVKKHYNEMPLHLALAIDKNKQALPYYASLSNFTNDGHNNWLTSSLRRKSGYHTFHTVNMPIDTTYVPYHGATQDVNLGSFGLLAGSVSVGIGTHKVLRLATGPAPTTFLANVPGLYNGGLNRIGVNSNVGTYLFNTVLNFNAFATAASNSGANTLGSLSFAAPATIGTNLVTIPLWQSNNLWTGWSKLNTSQFNDFASYITNTAVGGHGLVVNLADNTQNRYMFAGQSAGAYKFTVDNNGNINGGNYMNLTAASNQGAGIQVTGVNPYLNLLGDATNSYYPAINFTGVNGQQSILGYNGMYFRIHQGTGYNFDYYDDAGNHFGLWNWITGFNIYNGLTSAGVTNLSSINTAIFQPSGVGYGRIITNAGTNGTGGVSPYFEWQNAAGARNGYIGYSSTGMRYAAGTDNASGMHTFSGYMQVGPGQFSNISDNFSVYTAGEGGGITLDSPQSAAYRLAFNGQGSGYWGQATHNGAYFVDAVPGDIALLASNGLKTIRIGTTKHNNSTNSDGINYSTIQVSDGVAGVNGTLNVTGNTTLNGLSTAPTPAVGTNNTQIATTAFVASSIQGYQPDLTAFYQKTGGVISGTVTTQFPDDPNVLQNTSPTRLLVDLKNDEHKSISFFTTPYGGNDNPTNSPIGGLRFNYHEGNLAEIQMVRGYTATDGAGLSFHTSFNANGTFEAMRLTRDGRLVIGATDPKSYMLAVAGNAVAQSMTVKLQGQWGDYVFDRGYHLPSLNEVKAYITANHHLSEIPSAAEVAKDGINLGEMNKLLTKKVEELTLYLLEKDQEVKAQEARLNQQEDRLRKLEALLNQPTTTGKN